MLSIVKLGHPALRVRAEPVVKADDSLIRFADDMLETKYAHDGCGLAANQGGVPRRIVVIDTREAKKRPSVLRIGGKSRSVHKYMPMILINPEIELSGARELEKTHPGCGVALQADENVPYRVIVRLFDAIREAGIRNLPAFTRPPGEAAP